MKTFWYATLVSLLSLLLGGLVGQSFGADFGGRSSGRAVGPSMQRGVQGGVGQFRGSSPASAGSTRRVSGNPLAGKITGGNLPPVVKPRVPSFPGKPPVIKSKLPIVGPIKPPVVKPFPPIKTPPIVGPIKPPVVGPIKPFPPIKPPIVKPFPPIVGPIGPIGPIKPLPPICPNPPIRPPWHPGGHCGPCLPPWWAGCYRPCSPICVTLPVYCSPKVISETVVVEETVVVADSTVEVEEKLMQVPVGATLTFQDAKLETNAGQVMLQLESLSLQAQVDSWKAGEVVATLPMFTLEKPIPAKIWLLKANGEVANMLDVELIPAKAEEAKAASAATVDSAAAARATAETQPSPSDELASLPAPSLEQLEAELRDLRLEELQR